ncbi:MAG: hypothetical protein HKN78_03720 [Sphingomonadaceae bacterium]|nr:hypothetical protein [Sphingomonadaceae bacterium]
MTQGNALLLCLMATIPAACGSIEIGNLGGCYEIDDAPAFRIDGGYGIHADGQRISRIRASETSQGDLYTATPALIAVAGNEGYSVRADRGTPEGLGFIDKTLFGSIYLELPTDAEEGGEAPMTVRAYRTDGRDC